MIKTVEIQIRDPYILNENGTYYLFGSTDTNIWGVKTSEGFRSYKSTDLKQWEGPFDAFIPDGNYWGKDNFWAPEVHVYQGSYYMFATFRGADKMRGTAILKADNPLGPYKPWSDGPVTPADWMSLDGTFYMDDEGHPYIVFCHEWVQIMNGEICVARLSEDLKEIVSEPTTLLKSTDAPWTARAHSREHNMIGYVTDGPYMYRMKNNKLMMLWSCMSDNGYTIGYAVSDSGNVYGPWKQHKKPLFAGDGGHGMVFESKDGTLYLTVHTPNDTPNERAAFFELSETEEGFEGLSETDRRLQ